MSLINIIGHRGYWQTENEKNTEIAFRRALENGFGIETDFRDCAGKLVISHNPPSGNEMLAEDFFSLYKEYPTNTYLALNIKADGLQDALKHLLDTYAISNYFVFDMSICDTIGYIEHQLKIFSRLSEYEHELPFFDNSDGIWYDMFYPTVFNERELIPYILHQKKICIVSPELHNQDYISLWEQYKRIADYEIMLCTDKPAEANSYFNQI